MPTAETDFIMAPPKTAISFGLEPAHNLLHSMSLISKWAYKPEGNAWAQEVAQSLPKEMFHRHRVVVEGLYYALDPLRSWPSFEAYIDHLATVNPCVLRDRLFHHYLNLGWHKDPESKEMKPLEKIALADFDISPLLANRDAYLAFLLERFPEANVDAVIETEAHALINDLPRMQNLIVTHIRYMWEEVLKAEWTRLAPMLQDCIDAFEQLDLHKLPVLEATRQVLGHDVDDYCAVDIEAAEQVVFVPAVHTTSFVSRFMSGNTAWLLFNPRVPQGVRSPSLDLSRSDLLTRLQAVADDTRLRILQLVNEHGELCSQDLIRMLGLSQSVASRHLQQLSATGYLIERRRESAKCYSLGNERINDTLDALSHFLKTS